MYDTHVEGKVKGPETFPSATPSPSKTASEAHLQILDLRTKLPCNPYKKRSAGHVSSVSSCVPGSVTVLLRVSRTDTSAHHQKHRVVREPPTPPETLPRGVSDHVPQATPSTLL